MLAENPRHRHRRRHPQATRTAAAVSRTGAVLDQLTVPADAKGYRRLIAFGERHDARLWPIEGTGSFGAGLTTALLARSERVVQVDRPQRPARRAGAKSDDIDAVRAAHQVLAGQGVTEPPMPRSAGGHQGAPGHPRPSHRLPNSSHRCSARLGDQCS